MILVLFVDIFQRIFGALVESSKERTIVKEQLSQLGMATGKSSSKDCSAYNDTTVCYPQIPSSVFVGIIVLPILVFVLMVVAFYLWRKCYFNDRNIALAVPIVEII